MHQGWKCVGIHNNRKERDINFRTGKRMETNANTISTGFWNAKLSPALTYLVVIFLVSSQNARASKEDRVHVAVSSGSQVGFEVAKLPMAVESDQYRLAADNTPYGLAGNVSVGWSIITKRLITAADLIKPSQTLVVFSLPAPPQHLIFVNVTIFKTDATPGPSGKAPSFSRSSLDVSFVENTTTNKVQLEWARDRNAMPDNSNMKYDFVSGNEARRFSLSVEISNPSKPILYLSNRFPLDREEKSFYFLNVSAQDDLMPPAFAYLAVNVNVEDVNDNAPVFEKALYEVNVSESIAVGFPIVRVSATDPDSGSNGRVVYRLVDTYSGQFAIDPNSGMITAAKSPLSCSDPCSINEDQNMPLTRCDNKCVYPVEAADGGTPRPLTSRCYVSVTLIDENVHTPVISFNNVDARNTIVIGSDMQENAVVSLVVVKDSDHGPNGLVDLQIVGGNEAGAFKLEKTSIPFMFLLKLSRSINDPSKTPRYILLFRAGDFGTPQKLTFTNLTIIVNYTTVSAPVFENANMAAKIPDDAPLGSYVASPRIAFPSSLRNLVAYDIIAGNNLSWFSINTKTGLVVTSSIIDANVQNKFFLLVSAATANSRSFANLSIEIVKVRQNCPTFDFDTFYVTKKLNGPQTRAIITLSAGESCLYEYDSSVERNYPGMFSIGRRSGIVSFTRELIPEDVGVYVLRVLSYLQNDYFCPPSNSTLVLNVTIDETVDRPKCYPLNYFIKLSGFETFGDVVGRIVCNSTDLRKHLKYTISSNQNFVIDPNTGYLKLSQLTLLSSLNSLVSVKVQVLDRSTGLTALDEIKVFISSNTFPALNFTQPKYSFTVVEDNGMLSLNPAAVSRTIGQVFVTSTTEQSISYMIADGDYDINFNIDSKTGWLRQVKLLDRERRAFYNLTVAAYNALRFAAVSVDIIVADVNDNRPVIWNADSYVELLLDMPIGFQLLSVKATDLDFGNNSSLKYELSSDVFGLVLLDKQSGVISLNMPINMSPVYNTTHVAYIEVSDQGNPSLKSSTSITFVVKPYPVQSLIQSLSHQDFNLATLTFYITESSPVNSIIHCLATPPDYSNYRYAILHGNNDGRIELFPDGCLYVAVALDRESVEMYKLLIGVDSRESCDSFFRVYQKMTVLVVVLDDNDNPPIFLDSSYAFEIAESSDPATEVGIVTAIDSDIGDNGDIIYSVSNNSFFRVDPVTGLLTTLGKLDREEIVSSTGSDIVLLRIMAKDRGIPALTSEVTASVTILDVNDNPPIFDKELYSITLSRDSEPNKVISRVKASDKDSHDNGRVSYAILSSEPEESAFLFEIDEASGDLTLVSNLTFIPSDFLRVTILAFDNGSPVSLYTTTSVEIILETEEPEDILIWKVFPEILTISRYLPVGSRVARVKCKSSRGTKAQYSIDNSSSSYFTLEANTGRLFLTKSLKSASSSVLNIAVRASGLSVDVLRRNIIVNVTNQIPFIPSNTIRDLNQVVEINNKVFSNMEIYRLRPRCLLPMTNVDFEFSIRSSLISNLTITKNTGIVSANNSFTLSNTALIVIESCLAGKLLIKNRFCYQTSLTLTPSKSQITVPRFLTGEVFAMDFDAKLGSFVGRVKAKVSSGRLVYSLDSDSCQSFAINPKSGIVYLRNYLLPSTSFCNLSVSVTVGFISSSGSRNDYLVIIGNYQTSKNFSFAKSEYSVKMYENLPSNSEFITVSTTTTTSTTTQRQNPVEYYIIDVNFSSGKLDFESQSAFSIDRKSGLIKSQRSLDREEDGAFVSLQLLAARQDLEKVIMASTVVTIEIMDRNDNTPLFIGYQKLLSIPADTPVQSVLTTYTALDSDSSNVVTYSFKSEPDDGRFALDPSTGSLKSLNILQRGSLYRLTVTATDGERSTNVSTEIRVEAARDTTSPKFLLQTFVFRVREGSSPGAYVGQVLAGDERLSLVQWNSGGGGGEVVYSISGDGKAKGFEINSTTGVISLAAGAVLDREKTSYVSFAVGASKIDESSSLDSSVVVVEMVDVNDNPPLLSTGTYKVQVDEEGPVPLELLKVIAVDPDSSRFKGDSGSMTYKLDSMKDYWTFRMDSRSGQLLLLRPLDREKDSSLSIKVLAIDGRQDDDDGDDDDGDDDDDYDDGVRLTSTATVIITVANINDNPPKFINLIPDRVSISEDAKPGTTVFEVKAIDLESSPVTYDLQQEGRDRTFSIDQRSGQVTLIGALDREQINSYTLRVSATEAGNVSFSSILSTTIVVVVDIVDVNDNAPTFERQSYSLTLDYSSAVHTCAAMLAIRAVDADDGLNGAVRYSIDIVDKNLSNIFYIDPIGGELQLNFRPQLAVDVTFAFSVVASDLGRPQLSSRVAVSIRITGVNGSEYPVFTQNEYHFGVVEQLVANYSKPLLVNQLVLANEFRLKRISGLTVEFGMLESEDEDGLPFVVEKSGRINCVRTLNYEEKKSYRFKVYAKTTYRGAKGTTEQSSSSQVVIEVVDSNDHSPEFIFSKYKVSLSEDASPGGTVAQVLATDEDDGDNGRVWYSIYSIYAWSPSSSSSSSPSSSSSITPSPFKIDSESGLLTLVASLDREEIPGYRVVLRATDRGFKSRTGTAQLFVVVLDVNDNAPSFQRAVYSVALRDPTATGTFVCGVTAVDVDRGSNATIAYSLTTPNGQPSDLYQIDPNTGVVMSLRSLSSSGLSGSQLEFVVVATDKGNPKLSSNTKVSLSFYPVTASEFPVFSSTFPRTITANGNLATAGSILAVVSATSTKPTPPIFTISGGNVDDRFAINWKDGRLVMKKSLVEDGFDDDDDDRSTGIGVSSTIWIEARDMDGLSSYLPLTINVTGYQRFKSPLFSQPGYRFSVSEAAAVGSAIATVGAVAQDATNADLSYNIRTFNPEDDGSKFTIGSSSGILTLVKKLDKKQESRCRFWVVAYDARQVSASSSVEVVIEVISSLDGRPTFSEIFSGSVLENSPIGTYVFTVTTSEANVIIGRRNASGSCVGGSDDAAASTRYYFVDASSVFAIDELTGVVTVSGNLDFESKNEYVLKVSARRNGFNVETLATIDVIDDNDLPPTCTELKFQAEIPLQVNQSSPVLIGSLSSGGSDGKVAGCYRSRSPLVFIKLDGYNLTLRSRVNIPSKLNKLKFYVERITWDLLIPQLMTQCPVVVEFYQQNIHTPVFNRDSYIVAVPKDADVGYHVMTFMARYNDTWSGYSNTSFSFSYSIVEDVGSVFVNLNSTTGQMTLKKKLSANLSLTITATDFGLKPKSTRTKVFLHPIDPSTFNPSFDQNSFTFSIDSTLPVGSTVSTLTASDASRSASSSCFIYDLEPEFVAVSRLNPEARSSIPSLFAVNGNSGEIRVLHPLNETGYSIESSAYKYKVTAFHCNVAVKKCHANVTFVVVRRSSERVGCYAEPSLPVVPIDVFLGHPVTSIGATEGFSRPSQTADVTSINDSSGYFILSEDGYNVILKAQLSPKTLGQIFNVTSQIATGENPILKSHCGVQITVSEPDDLLLSFDNTRYSFSVNETSDINSYVGSLSARLISALDFDRGSSANSIIFSIISGVEHKTGGSKQSIFFIDSTGQIFLANPSLLVNAGSMGLLVSAIYVNNISGRVLADTCRVSFQVRSFHVRLVFIPGSYYSISISESTPVGASVIRVMARVIGADDEIGNKSQTTLTYSLLNFSNDFPFQIDPTSGWIKVISDLTIDASHSISNPIQVYNFTAQATYKSNTGESPVSSSATVMIVVTSQYANKTQFECLSDKPCLNNGTCQRDPLTAQTSFISYSCRCPINIRGSDCSVQGLAFEALKSQIVYENLPQVFSRPLSLGIELSTLRQDSLLVYYTSGNKSFVTLETVKGQPRVRLSAWSGNRYLESVVDLELVVADGSWWRIRVDVVADKLTMTASKCPSGKYVCNSCEDNNSGCSASKHVDENLTFDSANQKLYVGGVGDINILLTNPRRTSTHTFEGCLRYLTLGDLDIFQRVIPSTPAMSSVKSCSASFAPALGVERKSKCASHPCANSGICQETLDAVGYKCLCQPRYTGKDCINETQPIELQSGSTLDFLQSEDYRRNHLLSDGQTNERRKRSSSSSPSSSSSSSLRRSISLNVKTTEEKGLLLSTKSRNSKRVLLYIHQGHLTYDVISDGASSSSSSSSSSSFSLTNSLLRLSDGVWHQILLEVYGGKVLLSVDEHTVDQSSSLLLSSSIDPLDLDLLSFTLGAVETTMIHGDDLPGFTGCLSNFTLDDQPQPTSGSNHRFDVRYFSRNGSNDSSPPLCFPFLTSIAPVGQADGWKIPVIATASVLGMLLTLGTLVLVVIICLRRRKAKRAASKKDDGIEISSLDTNRRSDSVDANASTAMTTLNSNRPDIVVTGRRRRRRSSWSDDDSVKEATNAPVSRNQTPLTTLSEAVDAKNPSNSTPIDPSNRRFQNRTNAPRKPKFSIITALPQSAISVEARSVASTAFDRRILDDEESTTVPERAMSPSESSVHLLGLDKPGFRIAQGTKVGPLWTSPALEKPLMKSQQDHLYHQIGPAPRSRSTEPRHVVSPTVGLTLDEIKRCSNRPTSVDLFAKRTPALQPPSVLNRFRDFEMESVIHPHLDRTKYFTSGRRNYGRKIDDSDDDDDFDDKTDAFTCSEFDLVPQLTLAVDRLDLRPPPPRPNSAAKRISSPAEANSRRDPNLRSYSTSNEMFHTKPSDIDHRGIRSSSTVEMMRPRRQLPTPTAQGLIGPDLLDWNFDLSWNSWLSAVAPVFHELSRLPSSTLPDHSGSAVSLKNHISSSSCLSVELDSKRQNFSGRTRLGRLDLSQDSVLHFGGLPSQRITTSDDLDYGRVQGLSDLGRKGGLAAYRLNEIKEEQV